MKLRAWNIIIGVQICFMTFTSCRTQDSKEKAETPEHQVELTSEQRLENIKSDLKIVKGELTKDGKYNCCVHPGCDWCVLKEGQCECHDNITVGKAVCPDCGLGWHNGEGVITGMKADRVKWDISHAHAKDWHKH